MPLEKHNDLLAVLVLPLLLFGLTYGLTGFYYETNDDQIITLLLRGVTIRPALADLSIYFFGFSHLLAWLYALLPAWPWYGLLLYGWLLVATGLSCWLLLQTMPRLKPGQRWGLLAAFYVFCWLEHVMWFNYMRVPLLLAGTSFLFLLRSQEAPAPLRWWPWLLSGLLFLAALCIRPSAAVLGLLVVAPACLLTAVSVARRGRFWVPAGFFGALAVAFFLWLQLHQRPAARQYQQLDLWKSAILDYGIYQPRLPLGVDSLAFAAIGHWFLADQQVLHADFYRQHGSINLLYISQVAPGKLAALLLALLRDQFFLLWLNALLLVWLWVANRRRRRALLGYQVYFWTLLLLLGLVLKLPPRVLSPCLSLYTLVHLLLLAGAGGFPFPRWRRLAALLTGIAGLAYLGKTGHRVDFQRQRQQAQEQFIAAVARYSAGQVLVSSALPDYFRSLSPFRNYNFGATVVFPLTGWSTLDPGFRAYYRHQTGGASFMDAVIALSRQPNTVWLLDPEFALFLRKYTQVFHGAALPLVYQDSPLGKYGLQVYYPVTEKIKKK